MREIKFRAWWEKHRVMAPVYHIRYNFFEPNKNVPSPETLILREVLIDTHSTFPYNDCFNHGHLGWNHPNMLVMPEEITLMQFTGLKDKNGKEIYEGDILRWRDGESGSFRNKLVIWNNQICGYELNPYYPIHNIKMQGEVIGNVFENKDLLLNG